MQVKKYDEVRQVYTLKPKVKEDLDLAKTPSLGDVEAKHDEISDQITIEFRAVQEGKQISGFLTVPLTDKILNMRDMIPVPKANSFCIMYKGEIVKGDDTFLKRLIPQGS